MALENGEKTRELFDAFKEAVAMNPDLGRRFLSLGTAPAWPRLLVCTTFIPTSFRLVLDWIDLVDGGLLDNCLKGLACAVIISHDRLFCIECPAKSKTILCGLFFKSTRNVGLSVHRSVRLSAY